MSRTGFSLVLLGGFLGAGKTTTMVAAARRLGARGRRVATITNDQGDRLVDTDQARAARATSVGEVAGGCFCCRFEDFAETAERVVQEGGADVVIAEAVGSCADLQATVVRPLRRRYGDAVAVAPLTVVVEPARLEALDGDSDLAYLLGRQLEEADVIALNKADTRTAPTLALTARLLEDAFPAAAVVPCSARDGRGLDELLALWEAPAPAPRDLDISYPRYARAEAALGWLNTDLAIERDFDPAAWAEAMLAAVSAETARRGHAVGHVKLAIPTPAGRVTGNLVAAGDRPDVRAPRRATVERASALLNARVACPPGALDALVRRAASAADAAAGTRSTFAGTAAFAPGYPRPVHRLEAAS
jgi:Ni2+-binding GTPase involved in maturation of urease and hydrogenase